MQTKNSAHPEPHLFLSAELPAGDWRQTRVMAFQGKYLSLKNQPEKRYETISMGDILSLIVDPANATKEDALATIGSNYDGHDARTHHVQADKGRYSLLRFDIDVGNPSLDDVLDAFKSLVGDSIFLAYSTSSATADSRRWRVLVPLLVPVSHELRQAAEVEIRESIEMLWGFEFDQVLDRAGQHICLPAVAPNKRNKDGKPHYYESSILGETPLDLERSSLYPRVLGYINQSAQQEKRRQAALEDHHLKREIKRQAGDKSVSHIDWYNQHHSIEGVLLDAGYEQNLSNPRDWRSPLQTTSSYATRSYGDYFVTLSGSDAQAGIGIATRNGARVGDAFSVFLHFMHRGDRSSALSAVRSLREGATSSWPDGVLPPLKPITHQELKQARLTPRVIVQQMLYSDVRLRIGPGGSSKTTLATYEAVVLAIGRPLWGRAAALPVRTVFITREDSREILVARIRSVMEQLMLDEHEEEAVLENITVMDFTDITFRLSAVQDDVVIPHRQNLGSLIDTLREWRPDWLICDPLVSFGVGESRVNDSEQGLIEAFRLLRNELKCCIEGIHHTGKAVARDKVTDQYAGRGGSALADGARMVVVIQPLTSKEWGKSTGTVLADGETGLIMAFPKLSYCKAQASIYIRRRGFEFRMETSVVREDPDEVKRRDAQRLHEFLLNEKDQNRLYTMTELEKAADKIHMTRAELRDARTLLINDGRLIYHGGRGQKVCFHEALVIDRFDDDSLPG